jgi:hypothetical protein
MKKLIFLLLLLSGYCYGQTPVFEFEKDKLYKIQILGVNDSADADNIARTMEKMGLSIFSFVDFKTGFGYFIVDNYYKVHEIEKMINNKDKYAYVGYQDMALTEDNFLEIYLKRGGVSESNFSEKPPKKIIMGPFNDLTSALYKKAVAVWVKKYPEKSTLIESYYIEKIRSELPKFEDTGNPKKDSLHYYKLKDKWILENAEKYERLLKYKGDE